MTIDEAIKVQRDILHGLAATFPIEYKEALQLGIEALKRLKAARDPSGVPEFLLLPGETKE